MSHDVPSNDHIDLQSDEQVIAVGRELLEATNVWKRGKVYQKKTVQTYFRPKDPGNGTAESVNIHPLSLRLPSTNFGTK